MNGYRFSIIPAAAVTDEALEPRDLQVLCLIGRHTDRNGWCRRSQVKMADELRCGRATVQRALERLYDAKYLQRKLEGTRRGEPPAEGEQPFRAHSYRVLMDRDAAADELAQVAGVPTSEHPGVPIHGQGVPAIDGHGVPTHTRAPIEGPSFKPTPLNLGDDENLPPGMIEGFDAAFVGPPKLLFQKTCAGAEEVHDSAPESRYCTSPVQLGGANPEPPNYRKPPIVSTSTLAEFQAAWGTSAIDNVTKTMHAFGALTPDERRGAIAGIGPFRAELERNHRTHPISGWRYLQEKRWALLSPPQAAEQSSTQIKALTRDWWALLLHKIERGDKIGFFLERTLNAWQAWTVTQTDTPTLAMVSALEAYPYDGDVAKAWEPWLRAHGVRIPPRESLWVFLPNVAPPSLGSRAKTKREAV